MINQKLFIVMVTCGTICLGVLSYLAIVAFREKQRELDRFIKLMQQRKHK